MNPFESTIESPLNFLINTVKPEYEKYLRIKFENAKESNFRFDSKNYVIIAQGILPRNDDRGICLDEDTNTREYKISFAEFVRNEFEQQLRNSINLISRQSRTNTDGQDLKLYKRLLLDCLRIQQWVDEQFEVTFRLEINAYISAILKYLYRKFNRYYPRISEINRVKKYYKKREGSNVTGFRIKSHRKNANETEFCEYLKDHMFLSKRTRCINIIQFLRGRIPERKIDWIKDLHELHAFIDELASDEILIKVPGQKWKYMHEIFLHNGEKLPDNWQRNHNKLKDQAKKRQISRAINMLRPRQN